MQRSMTAEDFYKRGSAYLTQENLNAAIDDFNKAIELDPKLAKAYQNRGTAYCKQSDYNAALDDYNKAIELNQKYTVAYFNRGINYECQGNLGKAIADLDKAIELDPQDKSSLNYLNKLISRLERSYLFDLIKSLPPLQQIPLLKRCLDEKTILGERCLTGWLWNDISENIRDQLSGLISVMSVPIFLLGTKLVREDKLVPDVWFNIVSYYLKLNSQKCSPAIIMPKFFYNQRGITMFKEVKEDDKSVKNPAPPLPPRKGKSLS